MGINLAFQCCEHLNRAIVVEKEVAPFAETVNVVSQPAFKGSTVKGPFHLPRMLCMVECMIDEFLKR